MTDQEKKEKAKASQKRWAEKNKEYLRAYQRAWRAKYKQEHGIAYETARGRGFRAEH